MVNLVSNGTSNLNIGGHNLTLKDVSWNERAETYIWEKQKEAFTESQKQEKEGDKNKNLFYVFTIPTIVIPLVMTFVVPLLEDGYKEWVPQFFFMIVSVISAVSGFMNFGEKYGTNYGFAKDYQTIFSMIQLEMSLNRKVRRRVDNFMNEIRLRMEFLNQESPNVENLLSLSSCCKSSADDIKDGNKHRHQSHYNTSLVLDLV
jgi:hypothetical protein